MLGRLGPAAFGAFCQRWEAARTTKKQKTFQKEFPIRPKLQTLLSVGDGFYLFISDTCFVFIAFIVFSPQMVCILLRGNSQ